MLGFKNLCISFIAMFFLLACNKFSNQEIKIDKNYSKNLIESFTDFPDSANKELNLIRNNILSVENRTPFIEKYIKKFGKPVWENTISNFKNSDIKSFQGTQIRSNSVTDNNKAETINTVGFIMVPMIDTITKEVKSIMACEKLNDTAYIYKMYSKSEIINKYSKDSINHKAFLATFAFFQKKVNGGEISINSNFNFSNVSIINNYKANSSAISNSITRISNTDIIPSAPCDRVLLDRYFIDFGDGTYALLDVYSSCLTLEGVTVSSTRSSTNNGTSTTGYTGSLSGTISGSTGTNGTTGGGYSGGPNAYGNYTLDGWYDNPQNPYWSYINAYNGNKKLISVLKIFSNSNELLTDEEISWLNENVNVVDELYNYLVNKPYSNLTEADKLFIAKYHISELMSGDPDYIEASNIYASSQNMLHPIMIEIIREIAIEATVKIIEKRIPGTGDLQSIKDAFKDVLAQDYLSFLTEVLNLAKKRVPALAIIDLGVDMMHYSPKIKGAIVIFDKIKDFPPNLLNSFVQKLKTKCGGILEALKFDRIKQAELNNYSGTAFDFFKELADDLGISYSTFMTNAGPGAQFEMPGNIIVKYYPESNPNTGARPTISFIKGGIDIFKFRFKV